MLSQGEHFFAIGLAKKASSSQDQIYILVEEFCIILEWKSPVTAMTSSYKALMRGKQS